MDGLLKFANRTPMFLSEHKEHKHALSMILGKSCKQFTFNEIGSENIRPLGAEEKQKKTISSWSLVDFEERKSLIYFVR